MTEQRHQPEPERSEDAELLSPDIEDYVRDQARARANDEKGAVIDASDVERTPTQSRTSIDEGNPIEDLSDEFDDGTDNFEMLAELEMRADETDDPMEAVQEGMTYVPPIDPPTVPSDGYDNAEVASGMGVSSLDEPYNADSHSEFLPADDEVTARVREAIRADSSTTAYNGRIAIAVREGIVTLRGVVDDLVDSDNLLAVAEYVEGVEEVIDELEVRGL